jgi:hypothetical protein
MQTRCASQQRHLIRSEERIAINKKTEGWGGISQRMADAKKNSQTRLQIQEGHLARKVLPSMGNPHLEGL